MQNILDFINDFFTGPVMVCYLLLAGIILTVKTNFVQIRKLPMSISQVVLGLKKDKKGDKKEEISPFSALATALSGTIGTGNIAGVATAVALGGSGAIFWMWVSAFFGMATKYSEILLAVLYRKKEKSGYVGGAMYYIKQATGSKKLAGIFAFLCLLASFFIGNMTQSNTAAVAINTIVKLSDRQIKGIFIIIATMVLFIVFGGIKRISKITTFVVPFMAIFYISCCVIIIFMDMKGFFQAMTDIFSSAFNLNSATAGFGGAVMIKSMKIGFTRGIFTNEAGMGSAPIVHATATTKSPANQGLWGVFEVFFDTIVMCTLTGVVVIMSGVCSVQDLPISSLALFAFKGYLGSFAGAFIAISTVFFAFASIIGWSYYGESCVRYLFKGKNTALTVYRIVFSLVVYLGAISPLTIIWGLSDILNGLMILPNLAAVILLSNVIKRETKVLSGRK